MFAKVQSYITMGEGVPSQAGKTPRNMQSVINGSEMPINAKLAGSMPRNARRIMLKRSMR